MQKFWGASGDFWQRRWADLYDLCGRNEFIFGVFGKYSNSLLHNVLAFVLVLIPRLLRDQ
jgi:hypothetical protein